MYKPESVLENEIHKILWDFEVQTDHLILARRPNLVIINKRTCHIVYLAISANDRMKNLKKDMYSDLAKTLRKLWNMKAMVIQFVVGMIGKGTERVGNQRMNQDYNIVETRQNSKETWELAFSQTPMKDYQLMMV